MHLGATLRLLRVDAGLSLRDLARRIGVSGAYLSRVENGVDAPPTAERLVAIARELDVPPTLLMDVANRMSPYVADYLETVPETGTLLLELARRRLTGPQLARVRAFVEAEFPVRDARAVEAVPPLAPLLAPERMVLQLAHADWGDVLDVVAGRLASALPGVSPEQMGALLRQRDTEEAPCAVGSGVAVPHAFLAGASPVAALVTLARPLPANTPDGQPVRLVVAVVDGERGRTRLTRLAHVARLAAHGLAERLADAQQPSQVLEALEALEALR